MMPILTFLELKNFESSILHGIKNSYKCVTSYEYYYYYYFSIGRKKNLEILFFI